MNSDDLYDLAKSVRTRDEFVVFVEKLNEDLSTNRGEWQNNTLEQFLGGLQGFARDMEGYYHNIGEQDVRVEEISWRMAADMLLAAAVY
jgi:hypothetical protein